MKKEVRVTWSDGGSIFITLINMCACMKYGRIYFTYFTDIHYILSEKCANDIMYILYIINNIYIC